MRTTTHAQLKTNTLPDGVTPITVASMSIPNSEIASRGKWLGATGRPQTTIEISSSHHDRRSAASPTTITADAAVFGSRWTPHAEPLDYGEWMVARGLSVNTIKQRLKFANRRMIEWGTLVLPPPVLAAWLGQFTGYTLRTYTHHLNSIYRWLVETGRLHQSPLEFYRPGGGVRRRLPKPLNDNELAEVLDAALACWNPTGRYTRDHLYTFLQLGNLAGMRSHELAKINGADVGDGIRILGKGSVDATVPTHPHLREIASHYPSTGYWFPSYLNPGSHLASSGISNLTRAHFRAHGITFGSIHRMRHTFGTRLARNKVDPWVLRDLMRHASITTSECYVQLATDAHGAGINTLSTGLSGTTPPPVRAEAASPAEYIAGLAVGTTMRTAAAA